MNIIYLILAGIAIFQLSNKTNNAILFWGAVLLLSDLYVVLFYGRAELNFINLIVLISFASMPKVRKTTGVLVFAQALLMLGTLL